MNNITEKFQSGNKESDASFLLVIESAPDPKTGELIETNYITTPKEFHASDPLNGFSLYAQTHGNFDAYQDQAGQCKFFQLHEASLSGDLHEVVFDLSNLLNGTYNPPIIGAWSNAEEVLSSGAKALIPQLLQPLMDLKKEPLHLDIDSPQLLSYSRPLTVIFSECGLADVKRDRRSVTQGEAVVSCNGKEIVRYGDTMWLQKKNGKFTNGFQEVEGTHHGPVIGGWGSLVTDSQFISAALRQFPDRFQAALSPEKSLSQLIQSAQQKETQPSEKQAKLPTQER